MSARRRMRFPFLIAAIGLLSAVPLRGQSGAALVLAFEGDAPTLNGFAVPREELGSRLREVFAARSDKTLYLRFGDATPYGEVVQLVGLATSAGVERALLAPAAPDEPGLPLALGRVRRVPASVRLPRAESVGPAVTPRGLVVELEAAPSPARLAEQLAGRRGEGAAVWLLAEPDAPWSRLRDLRQACREAEASGLVLVVEGAPEPEESAGAAGWVRGFLSHLGLGTLVGLALVGLAALLGGVGMLVLRLLRRGPARFWTGPALAGLALLPLAAGVSLSGLGLMRAAGLVARAPLLGFAGLWAGLMEATLPLPGGILGTGGLALMSLALLALGRRRAGETPAPERPRVAGLLVAGALTAVSLALALAVPLAVHAAVHGWPETPSLTRLSLGAGVLLGLVSLGAALVLGLRAPRGAAPGAMRFAVLAGAAGLSLASLGGLIAVLAWEGRLAEAMDEARPIGLPEVTVGQEWPGAAPPPLLPPPPPPPPAPRPRSSALAAGSAPAPRPRVAEPAPTGRVAPRRATPDAVRVGGNIPEPRKLRSVNPVYPDIARQARVQGIVILQATIGVTGKVTDVEVLRSIPLLDDAAVAAVKQWEYEPTLLNGVPVPVLMTVTVNFSFK